MTRARVAPREGWATRPRGTSSLGKSGRDKGHCRVALPADAPACRSDKDARSEEQGQGSWSRPGTPGCGGTGGRLHRWAGTSLWGTPALGSGVWTLFLKGQPLEVALQDTVLFINKHLRLI